MMDIAHATPAGIPGPLIRSIGALMAAALLFCATVVTRAAADDVIDLQRLPRLEGAQDAPHDGGDTPARGVAYRVPGSVEGTVAAARRLFAADGWLPYVHPFDDGRTELLLKKGPRGLIVAVTADTRDRTLVTYEANPIAADLPVPAAAADIVFDETRPYLAYFVPTSLDATQAAVHDDLLAAGWSVLTEADIKARWPDATPDEAPLNGSRGHYGRDGRPPLMLTLARRAGGRTGVDIRVAPFALPRQLDAGSDLFGLPAPRQASTVARTDGPILRELKATVVAEQPAVLAFYRRALKRQGWIEDAGDEVDRPDEIRRSFSSAEGTAVLLLGHLSGLTTVSLVIRVSEEVLAARAMEAREAERAAQGSAPRPVPVRPRS